MSVSYREFPLINGLNFHYNTVVIVLTVKPIHLLRTAQLTEEFRFKLKEFVELL